FLFMTSSPTTLYTLSLHDALPISLRSARQGQARQALDRAPSRSRPYRRGARGLTHGAFLSSGAREPAAFGGWPEPGAPRLRPVTDRKSTRLNSSHVAISYAVFCLK